MQKKVICLISGGIDSPVAVKMMAKKYKVILLHFCLYPFYCAGSFKTFVEGVKRFDFETKIVLFPWNEVLSEIAKNDKKYQCVLCRKSMFKAAEIVAKKERAFAICTGEALAQKASQTARNLYATSYGIKLPILRPLIGLDKQEIIDISESLKLTPENHVGCCTMVPKSPATMADAKEMEKLFKKLKLMDKINKNYKKRKEIKVEKLDFSVLKELQ
jgi:thiamine biosynthesis protein ThiI